MEEEIKDSAAKVVTALQGTPMLLVLALLNVLVLGMVIYLATGRANFLAAERTELMETLNKCIEELSQDQAP
jgi:uncharacterized protein HemX